jgi:hypothetical protein
MLRLALATATGRLEEAHYRPENWAGAILDMCPVDWIEMNYYFLI